MTYLVKKFGHQELGSITDVSRRASRGRYLFIPRNPSFLEHLPHLSETIRNDYTLLTLIPLYKDSFERNYCTFVYNNDSYHDGSRNEYRIYSNRTLENYEYLFRRDDILILKPSVLETIVDDIHEEEEVYYAYLLQNQNSSLYSYLSEAVENSNIRGNYAIIHEEIEEVETSINQILATRSLIQNNNFENETGANSIVEYINNNSDNSDTPVENLFTNQQMFKDFLNVGYEGLCAVTREVILSGQFNNLQAAHIRPRSHGGTYHPNNGILLSRELHWAFDIGCFTLRDNLTIQVHPDVESPFLHEYDGVSIFIPQDVFFVPSPDNLSYHRNNIFGSFLNRGRITNPNLI